MVASNVFQGPFGISGGDFSTAAAIASGTTEARSLSDRFADYVNVKDYGVKGDGVYVNGAVTISSGTAALTVAGANFTAEDVGKAITVTGIGVAGAPLVTTIAGRTSATQVTLAANASTTVSAVTHNVRYGTNDTSAFQAALDAAVADHRIARAPAGIYMINTLSVSSTLGIDIIGARSTPDPFGDPDGTLLFYMGTGNAIEINEGAGSSTYVYRVNIKDLSITFARGASSGIRGTNIQETTIENVAILGETAFTINYGFDFDSAGITNIDNSIINYVGIGINIRYGASSNQSGSLNITRNNIFLTTTCISFGFVDAATIRQNWFEGFQTALLFDNDNANEAIQTYGLVVDTNTFTQSTAGLSETRALKVLNSNNNNGIKLQGKFINNQVFMDGGTATAPSYAISFATLGNLATPVVDMNISDNWFWGVTTAGVYADSTTPTLYGDRNETRDGFGVTASPLPNYAGSAVIVTSASPVFTGAAVVRGADSSITVGSGSYGRYQLSGGNSTGYVFGSFAGLGDGVHFGYNYYANAAGSNVIPNAAGGTTRISTTFTTIDFAVGAVNAPTSVAHVDVNGFTLASGFYLQLGSAYIAGDPTTTGYLLMKDNTGTLYRVPATAN